VTYDIIYKESYWWDNMVANERLSFVKENKYKVGLNLLKNRHSITNVVDKKWIDLSLESYKLECKKTYNTKFTSVVVNVIFSIS